MRGSLSARIKNMTKVLDNGCHVWLGSKTKKNGYGRIRIRGKLMVASRAVWGETHGDPGKMRVLHKCDNPACVNLDHLFLGTQLDNVKDCVEKGRNQRGETNGLSKLTEEMVRELRSSKEHYKFLAKKFGVSESTAYYALTKRTWAHIR